MKFPEYKYVGFKKSLLALTKIMPIESVDYNPGVEAYQSIYRFNGDILDKKSLSNIDKKTMFYSDYLVLDIDSKSLPKAHKGFIALTEQLDLREVGYECWFSGSKGFHIMIPTCQFDFQPTNDDKILKNMALELSRHWGIPVDERIYHASRILRLPSTLNPKSKLFKVPVDTVMSLDQILKLAETPNIDNPYPDADDYGMNDILTKMYRGVINKPKINRVILPSEEPKIGRSLFKKVDEGNRNEELYRLARGLARRSIVEQDALFMCKAWSDSLEKPIEERELQKTVMSAYTKGMNEMVDESNYKNHFYDVNRSLTGVKRLVANLGHNVIKTGYKFIDDYTMGLYNGDTVFIIARPGNLKTMILSNIMRNISKTTGKKTLLFSMEMQPDRLNMRHMQASEGMGQAEVIQAFKEGHKFSSFKEDFKDVVVIGLSSLSTEMVLGMIDWYLEEHGNVGAIGFDYLSLFRSCANNTEKTAQMATELKTRVAKAANCPIFTLVQAKREYEGKGGNIEIDRSAGKDSSSIEDSADYLIGLWNREDTQWGRILKSRSFDNDNFEENPYFTLNVNRAHMQLDGFNYIKKADKPMFNQVRTRQ